MTLSITPIVSKMPDQERMGVPQLHYLMEFENVLRHDNGNMITYDPGSMLVFTGACVKHWYRVAGIRRAWVQALSPTEVYALGVDMFETEVS